MHKTAAYLTFIAVGRYTYITLGVTEPSLFYVLTTEQIIEGTDVQA